MKLRLNEQEVIDGICVFVANNLNGSPEDVDVREINALDNGDFSAKAVAYGRVQILGSEDVLEGIFQFLSEYHSFNSQLMSGHLGFTKAEGFWCEVLVNE